MSENPVDDGHAQNNSHFLSCKEPGRNNGGLSRDCKGLRKFENVCLADETVLALSRYVYTSCRASMGSKPTAFSPAPCAAVEKS